jgi:hypothetical protein
MEVTMRHIAKLALVLAFSATTAATAAAATDMKPGKCTFADVERVKKHATEHIKYPAKGKDIKLACKKEWPDEFSKAEWACIDASVKDDQEYQSGAELLGAFGVK